MSHLRRASLLLESTVPVRTPKCSRQSLQRWGIGFPDLIVATETELQCGQTRFHASAFPRKKYEPIPHWGIAGRTGIDSFFRFFLITFTAISICYSSYYRGDFG